MSPVTGRKPHNRTSRISTLSSIKMFFRRQTAGNLGIMKAQEFCPDSGKVAPGLEGHEEGSESHGLAG